MSGADGLNDGNFSNINIRFGVGVGISSNQGNEGEVLLSGGKNKPNTWGVANHQSYQAVYGENEPVIQTQSISTTITNPNDTARLNDSFMEIGSGGSVFHLTFVALATDYLIDTQINTNERGSSVGSDTGVWYKINTAVGSSTGWTSTN